MTTTEFIARFDRRIRPLFSLLPPYITSFTYSFGRKLFLKMLAVDDLNIENSEPLKPVKLWDIDFGCNLFNAAGMFKLGEAYEISYQQGAGAYLAGTATHFKREGNKKNGIKHPFISYPKSLAASNWMGLPNEGSEIIAKKISKIEKKKFCPIGISISKEPDLPTIESLKFLIEDLFLFEASGVDFIELNESCPNVAHNDCISNGCLDKSLIERLEYISKNFLTKRKKRVPVVLKLSNDTNTEFIPDILDSLTTVDFDGLNFGNTSTLYKELSQFIEPKEMNIYNYFTSQFGGGLSGKPLSQNSLNLASKAVEYLFKHLPRNEFHIIRTGGIFSSDDLIQSDKYGISLNQWFTGYFHNFSLFGHKLYKNIYTNY